MYELCKIGKTSIIKTTRKSWKTLNLELQLNMNCFPYSPPYDADMAVSCYSN